MPEQLAKPARLKIPKWLVPTFGYAVALTALFLVFRGFDYQQLAHDVKTLRWGWVALGIILNLAVYVIDSWRWQILLSPAEEAPFGECTKAVFIGLVANGVLPAKAGEIIRCYLLSFWTDTPLSLALTSDAIGRVMDGIWMVIAFYVFTAGMTNIPRQFEDGALALSVGVAVLTALLLFVLFRREHVNSFVSGNKWAARFTQLLHEIHCLGSWKTLGAAFAISGLYLLLPVLSVYALFKAYGFDFSFLAAGVVLVMVHIGTVLPSAPANIGLFQWFTALALQLLEAEPSDAKVFSLILFFAHTFPQILVGIVVLLVTGLKLGEVHTHAKLAHNMQKGSSCTPVASK